jgi:hypothetical protein
MRAAEMGMRLVLSCDKKGGSEPFLHVLRLGRTNPPQQASLDRLEQSDNLRDLDVLAQEMVEDIEAALESFREAANKRCSVFWNERRSV